METLDTTSVAEQIDREECVKLLAGEEVGRLAVVESGAALVLPINYVMDGDAVVFRTDPGTKLEAAMRAPVCFEVDHIDRQTRSGWSVIVRGLAQEITTMDRRDVIERLWSLSLYPWISGSKSHLVRIAPHSITGRRIVTRAAVIDS